MKMFEDLKWKSAAKWSAVVIAVYLGLLYLLSVAFPDSSFNMDSRAQVISLFVNAVIFFFIFTLVGAVVMRSRNRRISKTRDEEAREVEASSLREHPSPRGPLSTDRSSEQGAKARSDSTAEAQKSHDPTSLRKAPQQAGSRVAAEYEVFVSYRRDHGVDAARLISNALKEQSLRTFLDVDELGPGRFDQALLTTIANTPHFVVLLTPHALDRSLQDQDWLRQEISQAIRANNNIVPIMWPEFQFPEPQALPGDIRDLRTYQGVGYSYEFFDAMINRLLRYLQ